MAGDMMLTALIIGIGYTLSVMLGLYLRPRLFPEKAHRTDDQVRRIIRDEIAKAAPHMAKAIKINIRDDVLSARIR